jgi:hypothetical protein
MFHYRLRSRVLLPHLVRVASNAHLSSIYISYPKETEISVKVNNLYLGVQSSLNFTFQNGKKEQTITVTLGAYMPEDKINEIQEKKGLLKILEEEEKRKNSKAIAPTEK